MYLTTLTVRCGHCDVFANPDRNEMRELAGHGGIVRAWLHEESAYTWREDSGGEHVDVSDALELDAAEAVPVCLEFARGGLTVHVTNMLDQRRHFDPELSAAVREHPWIARLSRQHGEIALRFDEESALGHPDEWASDPAP